jgi:hypothetical protein
MSMAPNSNQPFWLDWITRKKQETAYILFGLAGAFALLCIFLLIRQRDDWLPEAIVCGMLFFVIGAAGLWYPNRQGDSFTDLEAARVLVLGVGAMLGLGIAVISICRVITWWSVLTGGTEKWQGPDGWRILYWVGATMLGLGIIFASLLVGRQDEQDNPFLRRLLYSYNTALVVILVLFLLIVVNVIAAKYVPATSDWTQAGIFSLAPKSQNILQGLDEPVEVVILSGTQDSQLSDDVSRLFDIGRDYTSQIRFPLTKYSKDRDKPRVDALVREQNLTHDVGVLIHYGGDSPDSKWRFIPENDLYYQDRTGRRAFKGEDAIMTVLRKLKDDAPGVIYFTQGHGELSLDGGPPLQSAASLKKKLEKHYRVKALKLVPDGKPDDENVAVGPAVPDDAAAVIIAGYGQRFDPNEVQALRDFVDGKGRKDGPGKLLVLLGVVTAPDGTMVDSGLDSFLGAYGVDVGKNRVMAFEVRDPAAPYVGVKQASFDSPERKLAKSIDNLLIPLPNVRTIDPKQAEQFRVEPLLVVQPDPFSYRRFAWAETDLAKPADRLIREYFLDDRGQLDRQKFIKASQNPNFNRELSVGVTVAEGQGGRVPHGMPSDSKPRMVVIGNSYIAADEIQDSPQARETIDYGYSLIDSSIGYLREKPELLGIEAKKHETFVLGEKGSENFAPMVLQPLALMFLGVLGLGLGIWVVRQP